MSYDIVFHALFVCGRYLVPCEFIQVCILYQFFWETSIFALFALCGIRCNLHKLSNIGTIIAYIVGDRYSLFLFSLLCKKRYASQTFEYNHIWRKFLIKSIPLESFWDWKVLKIELIKKNVKHSQTERVKKVMNK